VLHPAGYDRHRSRSEIIAGLRKPSTKTSSAKLQGIGAVRHYLDDHLALTKKDPPGDRFLIGGPMVTPVSNLLLGSEATL
jgi:hypothetical protein